MDYVHRTNLIPDPRFRHVESMAAKDVTVQAVDNENGHRYVRAIYDGVGTDPYLNVAHDIITIPGSYRLFYNVFAQGGDGKLNIYTRESSKTNSYALAYSMPVGDGQTIRQASNQFTLKEMTIVRIVPPKTSGGMIMITECNLESASTFDQAYPYFDWATMPREAGGGVFLLAFTLLLSAAISGGWRHERADATGELDQCDGLDQPGPSVEYEQSLIRGGRDCDGLGLPELAAMLYPSLFGEPARIRRAADDFAGLEMDAGTAVLCGMGIGRASLKNRVHDSGVVGRCHALLQAAQYVSCVPAEPVAVDHVPPVRRVRRGHMGSAALRVAGWSAAAPVVQPRDHAQSKGLALGVVA